MRAALVQLSSTDDPVANLPITRGYISDAAGQDADLILTPEVTNCVSASRAHQNQVLRHEQDDITLNGLREDAARLGKWIVIGSLAILTNDDQGRFANRCFVLSPNGDIAARYDKIHMFDVKISETEKYRESAGYRPGNWTVTKDTNHAKLGLTICYDMRFPKLYQTLGQAGAQIITVPSAFSPVTGAAHWETLLRARAIETGAFILAPAQTGTHVVSQGKPRKTYGHSLAVSPWGQVLADGGTDPGVTLVDLDLDEVNLARARIPALRHSRDFQNP